MTKVLTVGIYRIQDPQYEVLPKNSKELVRLHDLRKTALHDVFDNQEITKIISWGNTDDTTSHEYVELILGTMGAAIIQPILIAGLKKLGEILAEKAVEETTSELVKWVIFKLGNKAKENKISEFSIRLKDNTLIQVDPPQGNSKIRISFKDGEVVSIKYKLEK
ncbi:hypothetical protein OCK74_10680 [Chitinophagaceae bacterium LB-8]|uniref:Uncharacterized protein n=1 Tax=Paraflavisolibacter caeni TaxID=2982496 RepID=A0A9X2XVW6_9BACT|nr:hypothetical protein [Paraflavisolibacter caeni]MCU7549582.1 hypothetical protein [Paraflavisolibacter caeni]